MKQFNSQSNFNDYIIFFLNKEKTNIKPSSYALYSSYVYTKIIPFFKEYKIYTITNELLQHFTTNLTTIGNQITNKGLSYSTTKEIINFLKRSIKLLFSYKIIKYFEISVTINADRNKKIISTLNDYEVIILRDHLKYNKSNKDIGLLITMYSGLRIGEICALKWTDIDLVKNVIKVSKTIQRIKNYDNDTCSTQLLISSPKTQNSKRNIPISIELQYLLKTIDNKYGYILSNCDIPIEPRSFRFYFKSILKKLNIEYRNFHCLRHTFATRIIAKTNDYKTVSELLGHSSVAITLDIYTHTTFETKSRCINEY